jgi:hypothetical protein
VTLAIALTMMVAGCVSVALECAVAGSVLLGGAMLIARYALCQRKTLGTSPRAFCNGSPLEWDPYFQEARKRTSVSGPFRRFAARLNAVLWAC